MSESPDLKAVTQVQQQIWSKGDFAMVANIVYYVSESLAEALDIVPDERVLDVACGSGNGALAAARRAWGNTVGADYVPALLERGRERAAAERLEIEFVEADAQDLPFEDGSFDVAMSIFGAMFAPDQEKAASELLRVVKQGGRIGMGNWCPDGAVGTMFQTISKHAPPPPGIPSPLAWGTEERVRELFGDGIADLRVERKVSRQPFRSPDHYIEFFRKYFGPTQTAYERVGPEGEQALTEDLHAFLEAVNTAGDRAMVLEADYLEVVATRA
ncbi:MAG TPA: methyltransferase domain-containing protein [Solirubrobacterales bacterium]|jgi:ubiquinone/menaquinone biosynthesis C-methylase UbiE|nr:methyltransferase domain-containing protein [Solirubrobacterales bacterium]